MYARSSRSPAARRRGVVLIVVLAMMGLLAVIGVSFATFSGQARSGAIQYGTRLAQPRPDAMIEYAIAQLINDTTNPMSALYGHGLKSDMYGNDATTNGFYDRNDIDIPLGSGDFRPKIVSIVQSFPPSVVPDPANPAVWVVNTNIPVSVGRSFIGWYLRLPGRPVDLPAGHVYQTFKVNDQIVVNGALQFVLTGGHRGSDELAMTEPNTYLPMPFVLDGRYRHAFNGTGIAAFDANVSAAFALDGITAGNQKAAQFANFRLSGGLLSDPSNSHLPLPYDIHSNVGLDEDYDAPDLENWFLAVQSADGSVVVPSFHRPGIVTALDWTRTLQPTNTLTEQRAAIRSASKILRPRGVDHPTAGFRNLVPDIDVNGDGSPEAISYDVDNDGDGVSDSVWLDLGFPVQRARDGSLYKPLFSFMVLGLNGRIPLNTAGNLNARAALDNPITLDFDEAGMPLFDHASHLGYSPSEINPLYALQNAYDPSVDGSGSNYPEYDPQLGVEKPLHGQFDDAEYTDDNLGTYTNLPDAEFRYIPVNLSQLRALLTGTRRLNNGGDLNQALVNGGTVSFPNNVIDGMDNVVNGAIDRSSSPPVAGRWGEPDAIPPTLSYFAPTNNNLVSPQVDRGLNFSSTSLPSWGVIMPSPVRAGRSPHIDGRYLSDAIDDNFDTYDFRPGRRDPATNAPWSPPGGPEAAPLDNAGNYLLDNNNNLILTDALDSTGRPLMSSERIRRFVTPIDPTGIGQVARYDAPADSTTPFGLGADRFGRVGFFHYFRPPGVPVDTDTGFRLIPNRSTAANPNLAPSYPLALNRHNQYRGYESFRNPSSAGRDINGDGLPDNLAGHFGAMPYNLSNMNAAGGYLPRDSTGVPVPPTDLYDGGAYVGTFADGITIGRGINSWYTGKLSGNTDTSYFDFTNVAVNAFPFGSLEYNDPNEMNLYHPEHTDAPFGPTDLEYLYRRQDIDGDNLPSRLSSLAPISFEAAADAATRRRLFSIETWDRIEPSFAHDNPVVISDIVRDPALMGEFYNYQSSAQPTGTFFLAPHDPSQPLDNVQMTRLQLNARYGRLEPATIVDDVSPPILRNETPGVAHLGRKINLNFPLPHSYDPREATRKKWITETYETLKLILPPHSIDTPQEVAKLGQFVVNIVDFRDPDNTITIWDNPDVRHLPARQVNGVDYPPSIHLSYLADGTPDPFYAAHNGVNSVPLRQYGMEYQPVAINEVLGFQYNYANPAIPPPTTSGVEVDRNARANRLYIELVNMLSRPGEGPTGATAPLEEASHLDLQGWDFVLAKEDPASGGGPNFRPVYVRPDPITGQIPGVSGVTPPIRPDSDVAAAAQADQVEPVVIATGKKIEDRTVATPWATAHQDNLETVDPGPLGDTRRLRGLEASTDSDDDPVDYYVFGGVRLEGDTPDDPDTAEPDDGLDTLQSGLPENGDRGYEPNEWDLLPEIDDPTFNAGAGLYFWLYLRRPANPLLPPQPIEGQLNFNPMVVVDSIRFPFSKSEDTGETTLNSMGELEDEEGADTTDQPIYSIERPQPFRGGQLMPDPQQTDQPLFIYGSSEQARPATDGNGRGRYKSAEANADDDNGFASTEEIHESIGSDDGNSVGELPGDETESWDYLVFNDRDFISVAELMLVPGCPPGLFTKQFVETQPTLPAPYPGLDDFPAADPPDPDETRELEVPTAADTDGDGTPDQEGSFSPLPTTDDNNVTEDDTPGVSRVFPHELARTYPYLAHEFFYSSDPTVVTDPADERNTGTPSPHLVGGQTGAGWHRMLEFFEVPAPVLDAIGPAAQGINFDWYREDRRPGQINLNLVIDEEVFFGLMDDPRMLSLADPVSYLYEPITNANPQVPRILTQVSENGLPAAAYPMKNRGFTLFTDVRDANRNTSTSDLSLSPTSLDVPWSGMKLAFSDFLKQRHGGSGYLFGYGNGATGTPYRDGSIDIPLIARDRPYRSLAHYDIFSTLLRPATMDPTNYTIGVGGTPVGLNDNPGLKRPELDPGYVYLPTDGSAASFYPVGSRPGPNAGDRLPIVPPIPPRRLCQVPDSHVTTVNSISNAATGETTNGLPTTYVPLADANTNNQYFMGDGLFPMSGASKTTANLGSTNLFPTGTQESFLGAPYTPPVANPPPAPLSDMRRHPYYRTELIQKLTNLTTPRTHQYAVWLTVGLFEVVQPGDRAQLVADTLGPELGSATGSIVRHRSFFILDRSRATGFDPRNPGDYRDVVVYSRRIE